MVVLAAGSVAASTALAPKEKSGAVLDGVLLFGVRVVADPPPKLNAGAGWIEGEVVAGLLVSLALARALKLNAGLGGVEAGFLVAWSPLVKGGGRAEGEEWFRGPLRANSATRDRCRGHLGLERG